jgi:hypothetical protein
VSIPFLGGIGAAPDDGDLAAGASVSVKLSDTAVFFSHSDKLVFSADTSQAGQPAVVNYSVKPCL